MCDHLDNNCRNGVDEEVTRKYCFDGDNDGFGDPQICVWICPPGLNDTVDNWSDCNDINRNINPDAVELCDGIDNNCDVQIDEDCICINNQMERCGETDVGECQYGQMTCNIHGVWSGCMGNVDPVAEVCDGLDNDCDGIIDNGVLTTFYRDHDTDGFGNPFDTIEACQQPEHYVMNNQDCNDNDIEIHPNFAEVCDYVDNNCDGNIDEGVLLTFYQDIDEDGFGDPDSTMEACVLPERGYVENNLDCRDVNPNVFQNAPEICDRFDNDCDGQTDEGVTLTFYHDRDGDGLGNRLEMEEGCAATEDFVNNDYDCDDLDPFVRGPNIYYRDADGDGFGREDDTEESCDLPDGYVENQLDCNDDDGTINPDAREIWDSIDNNCSGDVDEDLCWPGSVKRCGTNEGVCQTGQSICDFEGYWGDCLGGIQPSEEVCDELDNDCDGEVDEDVIPTFYRDNDGDGFGRRFGGAIREGCSRPPGYSINNGDCNDDDPSINPHAWERCDRINNDCDGQTDEGYNRGTPCSVGVGECRRNGTYGCTEDGWGTECSAVADEPEDEFCDQLDNDCDGETDESFNLGEECYSGLGECRRQGIYVCSDDGLEAVCSSQPGQPLAERCDGLDNDCDGMTDENFALGQRCYIGRGECRREGQRACSPQLSVFCDAGLVEPPEDPESSCDGLDNDCDGETDEDLLLRYRQDADGDGFGNPDVMIWECPPGSEGYVRNWFDCDDGNEHIHPGAEELCDGVDNDCGGVVDNGCDCQAGQTQRCGVTDVGECTYGIQTCDIGGNWGDCVGNVDPQSEECDGLDNNCNGEIDDGAGILYYLDDDSDGFGDPHISSRACARPDNYVNNDDDCNDDEGNIHPGAEEICDGIIDNDCNGIIDDDCPCHAGQTQQCGSADVGECEYGSRTCNEAGIWSDCLGSIGPRGELCDELDNNCDGQTDESYNLDVACYEGTGVCRREGTRICSVDGLSTICSAVPGQQGEEVEVSCDGLDNDCDGETDSGLKIAFYRDRDRDNFGDRSDPGQLRCSAPEDGDNYVNNNFDCEDRNGAIHPDAVEECDGIDNNCREGIDEGCAVVPQCIDNDGDGYGVNCELGNDCDDGNGSIHEIIRCSYNGEVCSRGSLFELCVEECPEMPGECGDWDRIGGFPVKYAISNEAGQLFFVDEQTGEEVTVSVQNEQEEPIPNADVAFIDGGGFEVYLAEHQDYVPYFHIFEHNSEKVLSMTSGSMQFHHYTGDTNENSRAAARAMLASTLIDRHYIGCITAGEAELRRGVANHIIDLSAALPPLTITKKLLNARQQITELLIGLGIVEGGECAIYQQWYLVPPAQQGENFRPTISTYECLPSVTDEICNDHIDNDCDQMIDNGDEDCRCTDNDDDGYCIEDLAAENLPPGKLGGNDCDDGDGTTYPGAREFCDGIDNSCDGLIDEGLAQRTFYLDSEPDGYGDPNRPITACGRPPGYVLNDDDCDDEVPGGELHNCWYDNDLDGYGDILNSDACYGARDQCQSGYVNNHGDCEDGNIDINPDAQEICGDGIDNNCDEITDEQGCLDPPGCSPDCQIGQQCLQSNDCSDYVVDQAHIRDGGCLFQFYENGGMCAGVRCYSLFYDGFECAQGDNCCDVQLGEHTYDFCIIGCNSDQDCREGYSCRIEVEGIECSGNSCLPD